MEKMESIAEDLLKSGKRYAIWGCGNTGRGVRLFLDEYSRGLLKPACIIDNNQSYWNEEVWSPDEFKEIMDSVDVVLDCVYVADQVEEQLLEMGYKGDIIWLSYSIAKTDPSVVQLYKNNISNIERIYDFLEDDLSKETLYTYLTILNTGDIERWRNVNGDSKYKLIDRSILDYTGEQVFIDVGAFTGDTLSRFLEINQGDYKEIICIEPDSKNYKSLTENVKDMNINNVRLLNNAVDKERRVVSFGDGRSESCEVEENGDAQIEAITLDSLNIDFGRITVKISTNGYDLNVLQGGMDMIRNYKPQIATYASGQLLWKIPLWLKNIVPEYKIYLRHYGVGRQAMIYYARI